MFHHGNLKSSIEFLFQRSIVNYLMKFAVRYPKKLELCDLSHFSMVSKRFYHISRVSKKFTSAMTFSKRILNFDTDYFDFLQSELRFLVKEIRNKFEERIVRNIFVFSLIDNHVEKTVYDLLPF